MENSFFCVPALVLLLALFAANQPGFAQDDSQTPGTVKGDGSVSLHGPTSDWDTIKQNPGKIGGSKATGVFYRERSSGSYLEMFDVVSNKMTGWTSSSLINDGDDRGTF